MVADLSVVTAVANGRLREQALEEDNRYQRSKIAGGILHGGRQREDVCACVFVAETQDKV